MRVGLEERIMCLSFSPASRDTGEGKKKIQRVMKVAKKLKVEEKDF